MPPAFFVCLRHLACMLNAFPASFGVIGKFHLDQSFDRSEEYHRQKAWPENLALFILL